MKLILQNFHDVNFQNIRQEIWFWFGFGVFLYGIGRFLDSSLFFWFDEILRTPFLDDFSVFVTEKLIWVLLALFAFVTGYRVWKNPDHHTKLVPALFSVILSGIIAFVAKSLFHVPRPFLQMDLIPLIDAPSFSFPSAHTAVAFALLIPFFRIDKIIGSLWLLFAILVGFARVYQNVHFPSDIAGGIFIGGIVGSFFSNNNVKKMILVLWNELEFRRQTFHFFSGFCVVFAHWTGFFPLRVIALCLLGGLALSWYSIHNKIPVISNLLTLFDRPRDRNFPGKGAYYFLLGVFLVFILFPKEDIPIAYASILILSVGDSLNHLFDKRPEGKIKLSWNRRKNLIGLLIGIIGGTIAAQFFVPFFPALLASTFALLIESVPIRFGKFYIDDNILVPIVAGFVLWVFV